MINNARGTFFPGFLICGAPATKALIPTNIGKRYAVVAKKTVKLLVDASGIKFCGISEYPMLVKRKTMNMAKKAATISVVASSTPLMARIIKMTTKITIIIDALAIMRS